MDPNDESEATRLAHEALHELLEGNALSGPVVKASTVAALRGDIEDRAWFQFQTANLKNVAVGQIPDDFFRLRRNIDIVPDRTEQRRIFAKAKVDFLDSRTDLADPETIFDAPVEQLDDMLAKVAILEADGRQMPAGLSERAAFLKVLRRRIAERTERYLRRLVE